MHCPCNSSPKFQTNIANITDMTSVSWGLDKLEIIRELRGASGIYLPFARLIPCCS